MFVSGILFGFAPCTNLTLHWNPQRPSHPQWHRHRPHQLYRLLLPFGFASSPSKPKLCRVSLIVRFCSISNLPSGIGCLKRWCRLHQCEEQPWAQNHSKCCNIVKKVHLQSCPHLHIHSEGHYKLNVKKAD